jgi:hypothetical protein
MSSGDQLTNKADLNKVTNDFIKYYYTKWIENLDELFSSGIFTPKTFYNVNGEQLDNESIIAFHNSFCESKINIDSSQFNPDGSRRIDILVKGHFISIMEETEEDVIQHFVQTFGIIENKGFFFIKNSNFIFL